MPSENSNTQYLVTKGELDEVADAIRAKGDLSQKLRWPHEMANAINDLEVNPAFNFSGVNVTSYKMLTGTTAWNNQGSKITGNIPIRGDEDWWNVRLQTPNHYTRQSNDSWGIEYDYFPSGYYSEDHYHEIKYDLSHQWEITPSTEDKTYYLLNIPGQRYSNQTNQPTGFNPNAFPYAITVKSAAAGSSATDWTGGGSINITSNAALQGTYFYNNSGSVQQGNIPIQQSSTTISRKTITPTNILTSTNSLYNGLFTANEAFPAGYYMGNHTNRLKVASDTQSSVISITPSTSSQIITLLGSEATYDYFPNAITIASVSQSGGGNADEEVAKYVNNTISGSIDNSYITKIRTQAFQNNSLITQVNCINCSQIELLAFQGCSGLKSVNFSNCTTIGASAFYNCLRLSSIAFPACTSINAYAFYGCGIIDAVFPECLSIGSSAFLANQSMTTASFPKCDTVEASAFYNCGLLSDIYFPTCTLIGSNAFVSCSNITEVDLPNCRIISESAFLYCNNITEVNLPLCHTVKGSAFRNLSNITTLNLPTTESLSIGQAAFAGCTKLTNLNISQCASIASNAFSGCSALTELTLLSNTFIQSSAFLNCQNLSTVTLSGGNIRDYAFNRCFNLVNLILTGSSVLTLAASRAFSSTPLIGYSASAGTTGTIYVPESLYNSYISATAWSYFSSRMVSYSGSYPELNN